ncbi:MAG: hypothetical protein QNJ46_22575 [Leptolyngbyaceae cyanobacterium MO_188.B28]|nr:hypothetical protein [Leptolyngbyaceae cyanobacterium MO_188.B28]
MQLPKIKNPITRYILYGGLLTVLTAGLKVLTAWAAERHLYSIPFLGGLLQSLEVIELSNILVFAILGMGIGLEISKLPRKRRWSFGLITFVLILPLVFNASYLTRQHFWIRQVADQGQISYVQAKQLTNDFLNRETGSQGFVGFFRLTTRIPILPTTFNDIETLRDDEKWFRSELTRFSGIEPGVFSRLFDSAGWGIRIFYILLSITTFFIYFIKRTTAERVRKRG